MNQPAIALPTPQPVGAHDAPRRDRCGPPSSVVCRWPLVCAAALAAVATAAPAWATEPTGDRQAPPPPRVAASDVVLHGDGTIHGRVVATSDGGTWVPMAEAAVRLHSDRRMVAVARCDANGRFRLVVAGPGVYQLAADTPRGSGRLALRVWSPTAAPPAAAGEVVMRLPAVTVRGQHGFAVPGWTQLGVYTGLLGGAIAAPVIYEATKNDVHVPHSP